MQTIVASTSSLPLISDRFNIEPIAIVLSRAYSFGPFVLQPERQSLLKGGIQIRIGSRSFDILTVLVERAGSLVSKRELVSRVWPDTFVEEGNLKVNVAALRRVLDESATTPNYIATIVGRGYRFVAPVGYSAHSA